MNPRYWTVVGLLAATGLLLQARSSADLIPSSQPLSLMPRLLSGWSGNDLQIDQDSLEALGPGNFLSRTYARLADEQTVDLFVGYFPTQRTGVSIHSPRNCLPGAGWMFETSRYLNLIDANGKSHRVAEHIISNGQSRQFVIYWYQAHGRSIANEYQAKMYLVLDAMRTNRTDGGLIRITTPINSAEDSAKARERAEAFAVQLAPMLPRFIPD
jgi:EpsI family protein